MNWRILTFVLAAVILGIVRLVLAISERRGNPFFRAQNVAGWNLWQLLIASFLTLFAELAFIRWIAVEVRVFAYFKNLALLLCFIGFGLGCALVSKPVRWKTAVTAFFGLLLVIQIPWSGGNTLEKLSENLGAAADAQIWETARWNWVNFIEAGLLATTLFLLLLWIFVPLGQVVSRQMNRAPSTLSAYSWNLLCSLAGILAFVGLGRLMLPPWAWLGAVLLGFALLQEETKDKLLVCSLLLPAALLLYYPSDRDHRAIWTPYQEIEYSRVHDSDGDFLRGEVLVNHISYQTIVDLSPEFLVRHAGLLKEAEQENPYNLPFRFAVPSPRVLVVGSGTGNDVAGALRNHSSHVDAVEIDPAILALGKNEHPEHPYDSPQVSLHLTDARAFLKRSHQSYDLVLFGLLDSHTQLSDYANMRIDNFVYTEESFREARDHLSPNGVMFVKFAVLRPWMGLRLAEMLRQTFGKPALVFQARSSYTAGADCFAISPSGRIEDALASDPALAAFVRQHRTNFGQMEVPVTTDDWPYLYQQSRRIPRTYFSVGVIVILVALGLYLQIPDARRSLPSLFFFCMGAGFLLLETQVISRLALYFGTTWQVNGIVIAALLSALLLANLVVENTQKSLPKLWVSAALLAGLLLAYCIPFARVPGPPAAVGTLAAIIFSVPVFFAGPLFSLEFRRVESPSAALGANILGAVAGGLLENLSLIIGMHALLLITMALYCLACLGLRWRRTDPAGIRPDALAAS